MGLQCADRQTVRRQSFWTIWLCDLAEALAHLLCYIKAMGLSNRFRRGRRGELLATRDLHRKNSPAAGIFRIMLKPGSSGRVVDD